MTDFRKAMEDIQAQDEARAMRLAAAQLRKFLAGALCAVCGDPLGTEDEIIQDDDDRTMHARCESADDANGQLPMGDDDGTSKDRT